MLLIYWITVNPGQLGQWISRIWAKSLYTSDLPQTAQLFARHRTEVSNSEVPEYLGIDWHDFACTNPRYTNFFTTCGVHLRFGGHKKTKKCGATATCQFFVHLPLYLRTIRGKHTSDPSIPRIGAACTALPRYRGLISTVLPYSIQYYF